MQENDPQRRVVVGKWRLTSVGTLFFPRFWIRHADRIADWPVPSKLALETEQEASLA